MRRRAITSSELGHGSVNVTPLIDVVMCLIVFFLIVARLATTSGLSVRLPESAAGAQAIPDKVLAIALAPAADGKARVAVDGEELKPGEDLEQVLIVKADALAAKLLAEARAKRPGDMIEVNRELLPVVIRADRDLPYGDLAPVLAACKKLGLAGVRLVTERGE